MDFNLFVVRSVSMSHCPNCNCIASLDRVKMSGTFDKILLRIFQLRSYHCRNCKWDGRVFLYKLKSSYKRVLLNYSILIVAFLLIVFIANIILKK